MNRITYLIIFFVLLAVGCTNDGRTNKSLVEIDSLLGKGMVDSAYNCLQAIPQKDLRTTDDSAYYYLLDTQSKYRLYKPIETTKDIEFSIRVYSKGTESSDKLASAYYYKEYGFIRSWKNKGKRNRFKEGGIYIKKIQRPCIEA